MSPLSSDVTVAMADMNRTDRHRRQGAAGRWAADPDERRSCSTHSAPATRRHTMDTGSFVGVGGLKIFTRSWHPTEGQPRAVVVIVHGFNSHSGYYLWVGEQLAANGLAVHALDLRGRGHSGGDRYHVDNADDNVDDVAMLVSMARSYHPGLPVFLLGHSAGGVVASVYALDHQEEISGLICESFAYELPA